MDLRRDIGIFLCFSAPLRMSLKLTLDLIDQVCFEHPPHFLPRDEPSEVFLNNLGCLRQNKVDDHVIGGWRVLSHLGSLTLLDYFGRL